MDPPYSFTLWVFLLLAKSCEPYILVGAVSRARIDCSDYLYISADYFILALTLALTHSAGRVDGYTETETNEVVQIQEFDCISER